VGWFRGVPKVVPPLWAPGCVLSSVAAPKRGVQQAAPLNQQKQNRKLPISAAT